MMGREGEFVFAPVRASPVPSVVRGSWLVKFFFSRRAERRAPELKRGDTDALQRRALRARHRCRARRRGRVPGSQRSKVARQAVHQSAQPPLRFRDRSEARFVRGTRGGACQSSDHEARSHRCATPPPYVLPTTAGALGGGGGAAEGGACHSPVTCVRTLSLGSSRATSSGLGVAWTREPTAATRRPLRRRRRRRRSSC